MRFYVKKIRKPRTRDGPVRRILKSPAIMASGISTNFLPSNGDELCDRSKLFLQEKHAGSNSNLISIGNCCYS